MFTQAMFNQVRGKFKVKFAVLTLTLRSVAMVWMVNASHSLESLKSYQPNDKQDWLVNIVANLTIATEIELSKV